MTPTHEENANKWLMEAGLRPTRQRVTLAALLVGDGQHRHVTAESLFDAAKDDGAAVSLATVYNTLRAFCDAGGRKRFRRRYPQAVAEVLGESVFQVAMKAREGAELFTEHTKLLAEFEKIVAKAKRTAAEQGQLSPLEHWRESVKEAEALVAGIRGVRDEHEARQVLADDLRARKADPVLYKAVVSPEAEEPPITMQDAKEVSHARSRAMSGDQTGEPERAREEPPMGN
eukprot:g20242.t1